MKATVIKNKKNVIYQKNFIITNCGGSFIFEIFNDNMESIKQDLKTLKFDLKKYAVIFFLLGNKIK